ncbi:MAG: hypothetical protein ACK5RG_11270 [Cyclobacteriaceae bacterium]|jgi:hypothetical protein|nr:hypothetical protein [Flammeovirgaceae bacterium]
MNLEQFEQFLEKSMLPAGLTPALQALWLDAKGDWDRAHEKIQDDPSAQASWIHAYLHRKEGDESNARYWYTRAGEKFPLVSLQEEWRAIATALLAESVN